MSTSIIIHNVIVIELNIYKDLKLNVLIIRRDEPK